MRIAQKVGLLQIFGELPYQGSGVQRGAGMVEVCVIFGRVSTLEISLSSFRSLLQTGEKRILLLSDLFSVLCIRGRHVAKRAQETSQWKNSSNGSKI